MTRNVVQLRWLWLMWGAWLVMDVTVSLTGLPWRGPLPLAKEIEGTIAVACFLAGVSIGCRDKAVLTNGQHGGGDA